MRIGSTGSSRESITSVLCVPQWQGSGASNARRLAEGARTTAALLPSARRRDVSVLDEPGPVRDGVASLDVLVHNLQLIRCALASLPSLFEDGPVVTAGGDCGVELAPISAAMERYGQALTVLWLDAHADLNTPESSPAGPFFHGMVLRTLLGDGPAELVPARPVRPHQVVLAGVRALDPPEREQIAQCGIRHLRVGEIGRVSDLSGPIYVHIDLDVLDPKCFGAISCPEPAGVSPDRLVEVLCGLPPVVGVGVTENAPNLVTASSDEVVLSRLLIALLSSPVLTGAHPGRTREDAPVDLPHEPLTDAL
jgi:arginase